MCLFCSYFLLKGGPVVAWVSSSCLCVRRKEMLSLYFQQMGGGSCQRWCQEQNGVNLSLVVPKEQVGMPGGRTLIFEWNCCNLEDTDLTSSLKRHGPECSRSNIQTKGPNKDRNQVLARRMSDRLPDGLSHWTLLWKIVKPFSVILYKFFISSST